MLVRHDSLKGYAKAAFHKHAEVAEHWHVKGDDRNCLSRFIRLAGILPLSGGPSFWIDLFLKVVVVVMVVRITSVCLTVGYVPFLDFSRVPDYLPVKPAECWRTLQCKLTIEHHV